MSWNPFAAGGLLGGSSRPPRPGMINNRRNRKAKLSKHASAQISQFQHGGITSGKFVLDEEDLKIMGVQSKLDITKRETMTQKANQHDELEILNIVKQNMNLAIEERMEEVVENPTYLEYYKNAIQMEFVPDGIPVYNQGNNSDEDGGDGQFEATIIAKLYQADLADNDRSLAQKQNSVEFMSVYNTLPNIKDDLTQTQIQLQKEIEKGKFLLQKRKELYTKILKLQKHINAGYRRATETRVARTYDNLRGSSPSSNSGRSHRSNMSAGNDDEEHDEDNDDDDELQVRGRSPSSLKSRKQQSPQRPEVSNISYSQRVLASSSNHSSNGQGRRSPSPATLEARRRRLAGANSGTGSPAMSTSSRKTTASATSSTSRRSSYRSSSPREREQGPTGVNGSSSPAMSTSSRQTTPSTTSSTSRRSYRSSSPRERAGEGKTSSTSDNSNPSSPTTNKTTRARPLSGPATRRSITTRNGTTGRGGGGGSDIPKSPTSLPKSSLNRIQRSGSRATPNRTENGNIIRRSTPSRTYSSASNVSNGSDMDQSTQTVPTSNTSSTHSSRSSQRTTPQQRVRSGPFSSSRRGSTSTAASVSSTGQEQQSSSAPPPATPKTPPKEGSVVSSSMNTPRVSNRGSRTLQAATSTK